MTIGAENSLQAEGSITCVPAENLRLFEIHDFKVRSNLLLLQRVLGGEDFFFLQGGFEREIAINSTLNVGRNAVSSGEERVRRGQ